MKTNILVVFLAVILTVTCSMATFAYAITNPGFESDWTGWTASGAAISTSDAHSGSKSAKCDSSGDQFYQTVTGLSPNTTYTLQAWAFNESSSSGKMGARNYGGSDVSITSSATSWTQKTVNFTTGASNTSVEIYGAWVSGTSRWDDFTLTGGGSVTPTPSVVVTPTNTITPTPSVVITPTNTNTPTPTITPSPTPTVTPSTSPGVNLALNKSLTFSSEQAGNEAIHINDNDTANRWSASPYPQWVSIDLGATYSVNKTETVPYQDRAYQYTIEVSTDGSTYTQVVDRTGNTTGGALLTDNFASTNARYVRLTVTGCYNYAGGWASICEFRVFGGGTPATPTPTTTPVNTPTPTNSPTATVTPTTSPGGLVYPADLLNLLNWKETLPIDTAHAGAPDEIKQPELDTFKDDNYFHLTENNTGVLFKAHCGGYTTSGSGYPRSELREMTNNGTSNASWSSTSGTHTLYIRQKVTHLPVNKPHVVLGQIHDANDDVTVFRLEGTSLYITDGDTTHGYLVDSNYQLGTIITTEMIVSGGVIRYKYNGNLLGYSQSKSTSGCYFKAGCYTQSNTSYDAPSAYGEVVIYDVQVTHQ